MFKGAIPAEVRSILLEVARSWTGDVLVPCAGNFTIERSLAPLPLRFHSNDVTLYSSALGAAFTGVPLPVRVAAEHAEEWGWLDEYLDTPARAASTILLCADLALGFDKPLNPYYVRLCRAYRAQWATLYAKTLARVEAAHPAIVSYTAADAVEWLRSMPDWPAISFPPYEQLGYEAQFVGLERLFEWDAPTHAKADEEWREALIAEIVRRPSWAVGLPQPRDGLGTYIGYVRTTNMTAPVHLYASGGPRRVRRPEQAVDKLLVPRLGATEHPADPITLQALTVGEFAGLRSHYLNPLIAPAIPMCAIAVMAAGKLVGAYALNDADAKMHVPAGTVAQPYAYLLSDFPIAPGVPRLSHLVLLAAQTRESQLLIESHVHHRVRSLVTSAFNNRPVSMKYRGAGFDLLSRNESDGHTRYVLNYGARIGLTTLSDVHWEAK